MPSIDAMLMTLAGRNSAAQRSGASQRPLSPRWRPPPVRSAVGACEGGELGRELRRAPAQGQGRGAPAGGVDDELHQPLCAVEGTQRRSVPDDLAAAAQLQ